MGADCKSAGLAFGGSNPSLPTTTVLKLITGTYTAHNAGVAQWLVLQPSKLVTRVRFPSPAPEDMLISLDKQILNSIILAKLLFKY